MMHCDDERARPPLGGPLLGIRKLLQVVKLGLLAGVASGSLGCASESDSVGSNVGVETEGAALTTRTPAEWTEACRSNSLRAFEAGSECTRLLALSDGTSGSGEAERIALALNLRWSSVRSNGSDLGALKFKSGARAARTVREWSEVDAAIAGTELSGAAERAAYDINRNYAAGVDRGALGVSVRTPVCGTDSDFVEGVEGRECSALHNSCLNAQLVGDCCDLMPRPQATACATGACDGAGACVAGAQPDASVISEGIIGRESWVSANGAQDATIYFADEYAFISLDGVPALTLPRADGVPLDLSHVRVESHPDQLGSPVAVSAPAGRRKVHLQGQEADVATVCLVQGDLSQLGSIPADCSGEGTVEVQCPQGQGDVTCRIDQGAIEVDADSIALAWVKQSGDQTDMHTMGLFGFCPSGDCRSRWAQCRAGQQRRCAGSGTQRCTAVGRWGPCLNPRQPETCNGVDDDRDGRVDEGTHGECDDSIPCTVDRCIGGSCRNTPLDLACSPGPRSACSVNRCLVPPAVTDSRDRVVQIGSCFHLLRNSWCTDVVDGCDCNGNEVCAPGGATDSAGCTSQMRYDYPTATQHSPCEADLDNCTYETCCETNPGQCRTYRQLSRSNQDDYDRACRLAGRRNRSDTVISETGNPVLCPQGRFQYGPAPFDKRDCEDFNECTANDCSPISGLCVNTALPDGTQVDDDCEGDVSRGCGAWMCLGGVCAVGATEPDPRGNYGREEPCMGPVKVYRRRRLQPTCAHWACDTNTITCVEEGDDELCNDGNWCNGAETCGVPVGGDPLPASEGLHGCQPGTTPCTDPRPCTEDLCDEETNTCSFEPDHSLCPGNAVDGSPLMFCDYTQYCDATRPIAPSTLPNGCFPVNSGGVCDDDNLCTVDSCQPTDEFGVFGTCSNQFICGDTVPVPVPVPTD
jgi:hypothetical protein